MTDRTPERIITDNNTKPPIYESELTKKFYNNMKRLKERREKEKKAVAITGTTYDTDERYVCIPADDCAICCERDALSNLFRTTCGHVFHNCTKLFAKMV